MELLYILLLFVGLILAFKLARWLLRDRARVVRTASIDSVARAAGEASANVENKISKAAAAFKQGRGK